jgi:3-oxoacyl-[acyl-carrier protein] reductase
MKKLDKKVAIVTGASKGIGASIAKKLATEGASVIVNYASAKEGAEKVVAEIIAAGGKAAAIQADVSKVADVERLYADTEALFGELDVLVNNAGIYEFGAIADIKEEDYHRQFNVNVWGLLLVTQGAVRSFGARGGSIINLGSLVTRTTPPQSVVYTASKAAVESITHVLSKELGTKNIRVNTISPGMVETEGAHTAGMIGSELQKQVEQQVPLGRIGIPEDIAPIAVFLASDDSSWLTGETLIASGGLR